MDFLPKEGVCGTIYLFLQNDGRWHAVSWDSRRYHSHGSKGSLEELRGYLDKIQWSKDWPRVVCQAPTRKMDPCVRIEFEYRSGRVQRLTGEAAEAWLENVNAVIANGELRYGQTQMNDHPWEFARKEADRVGDHG